MKNCKSLCLLFISLTLFMSCGKSYEEKKAITMAEREKMQREDSLALKIAVMPTIDCLPLFVAYERGFFKNTGSDIRLKMFNSQIECDKEMYEKRVEGMVTDRIRVAKMKEKGISLTPFVKTNSYWLLIGNKKSRITKLDQLSDKMIAMTRFSATDFLTDKILANIKKAAPVFKIQINDVKIRQDMLSNNEMDASWLPEPYATTAKLNGHVVLADSRDIDKDLGLIEFSSDVMNDKKRIRQYADFSKAYNLACDSLNSKGVDKYNDVVRKYYHVNDSCINTLAKYKFIKRLH